MISIEITAKKVEDAIKEGLAKLDAKIDDVNVEVLSQGGLFKKAKVRLSMGEAEPQKPDKPAKPDKSDKIQPAVPDKTTKPVKQTAATEAVRQPAKPEKADKAEKTAHAEKPQKPASDKRSEKAAVRLDKPAAEKSARPDKAERAERHREENTADITAEIVSAAETFLKQTAALMGVKTGVKSEIDGKLLKIELLTDDSAVIGYRGEALDALEYLASLVSGRGEEKYVKLRLDCNGYRVKREESLVALARRMADKCAKNNKKVTLEPMTSAHRRIIHAALTDDDRVVTRSEGREPGRRVVILPRRKSV